VAVHGNVTRAAGTLHRTQSAISVQIRRLEELLGTRLLDRQARGVTLTPAGARLCRAAGEILQLLDATAASFRQEPLHGVVKVGIPDDYGADLLTGIFAEFGARNANVDVEIRCGLSTEFPTAVAQDELDLAVYSGTASDPGEVLMEEVSAWVCASTFALPPAAPLPLALFDRSCWWRDAAIAAIAATGRDYRIALSSESVAGVKAAIKSGLAIGVLARPSIERGMRIVAEAEGLPALPSSRLLLIRRRQVDSAAIDAMAETIRNGFARLPA
jgi:DNA-binding transcriptional LysR family regulator